MENQSNIDYKIITLGDTNVGKTSLIMRYTLNEFNTNLFNTIGMDSKIKDIEIDSKKIKIKIWDSAGQERFRSMQKYYYNKVDGIIFVYDITKKNTLKIIDSWIDEVKENVKGDISFILVGNKTDLEEEREVSIIEGEKFAQKYNYHFLECSAANGIGVYEIFDYLVRDILKKKENQFNDNNSRDNNFTLDNNGKESRNKKKCCS